ncbi:MAG: hypothetical protein ACI8P3_000297 [Saprospiraceae bacterium]|jgi:hypothetical protein
MRDTKLLSLFKGLSVDDLRHVQKMLRSPFFTSNENLLALYNIVRPYHPGYDSVKLEKKNVFKKLFPEHDYSDIKFRNLSSEMVSIIEDYLICKVNRSDNFERRKQLLKIYKDSGHID